ncbi:MAG: hypothetical protein Q9169_004068 [Polycauliona sp. 2 TL-2023]
MARGNQRDKAREKNQKEMAGQKNKNTQSGSEFARTKEAQAAIMRAKQDGIIALALAPTHLQPPSSMPVLVSNPLSPSPSRLENQQDQRTADRMNTANAKKAESSSAGEKKK